MPKHGKKYNQVKQAAPKGVVSLEEALNFIKANPVAKFDETIEIAFHLGVDARKSDQIVRGSVSLPNGTGKDVTVLVFAEGDAIETALAAGAAFAGGEEMIEKVKGGFVGFDVAVSTTSMMKEVRKLGRVLGPRGLMPNPKTGTVTDDVAAAVTASKTGKVDFRMDRNANVSVPVGKMSFDADKLKENIMAIFKVVMAERPVAAKGIYIKKSVVSSTMGVGIAINLKD
ncbi:MAG: 50S ribosomal protein L1 [Kiritimatiellae bacterium]|jgi:large subunit ribosomal protein L1|nr:50S ribosomal protein L1 [Kiritimatiellia bacterium]